MMTYISSLSTLMVKRNVFDVPKTGCLFYGFPGFMTYGRTDGRTDGWTDASWAT